LRAIDLVVSVVSLAPVANDVETTDDLSDCKESNDLRSGNTGQGDFLLVRVADTG
jgi:hypothetical protein